MFLTFKIEDTTKSFKKIGVGFEIKVHGGKGILWVYDNYVVESETEVIVTEPVFSNDIVFFLIDEAKFIDERRIIFPVIKRKYRMMFS